MIIRKEQTNLRLVSEQGFVNWYVDDFMPDYLREFHQAFPRDELVSMVRRGRTEAIAYGFEDPASQVHFVTLMWNLGPAFHLFPGFREIAEAKDQPGPRRIEQFYNVSDEQGANAVLAADDRYWFSEPGAGSI